MKRIFSKIILLSLLAIVSCGPQTKVKPGEDASYKTPSFLIIEKEISGRILGQNLKSPKGLEVDFAGNIFVCDAGNDRIICFDTGFSPLFEKGGHGSEAGLLDKPAYINNDDGLNFLVTDEGNRRLVWYDSRLNYVDELLFYDEDELNKFGIPSGAALTSYGEYWIADHEKNQVAIFDNDGSFNRFIGDFGYSGGQLLDPEKIVFDNKTQSFFVCDAGNRRVAVYDSYGNFDYEINDYNFDYPVALDIGERYIWVLDGASGRIMCYERNSNKLFETGPTLPGNLKALKEPADIVILDNDRLLISDKGNNRILICRVNYDTR